MAILGSTTQPQQVSQAFIPPAAAAHGDEAWLVPEEDRIAVVTQAIPPMSFSIQSNLANPIHSEIPFRPSHLHSIPSNTTADQHTSMETSNQSISDHPLTSPLHPQSMLGNPGDQSMSDPLLISSHCYSILSDPGDKPSLHQQDPQVTDQSNIWSDFNLPEDFPLYIHFGAETNDSFPLSDLDLLEGSVHATSHPFSGTGPADGISSSDVAANAAAGGEIGRVVSGSLEGDLTTPAGALHVDDGRYEFPTGYGTRVHMEGDQSLDHVVFCTDITAPPTATNGAVVKTGSMDAGSIVDATSNPFSLTAPPEGIPSSFLAAANAAAGGEIGRTVSDSLGGSLTAPAGALHVDVGVRDDQLPPGHGSHVRMEGDRSLAHKRVCTDISTVTNGAVLEDGSMEDDSVGQPRRRRRLPPVGVGHDASSSATGPNCLRLKSAQGFTQPETGTDKIGNPSDDPRTLKELSDSLVTKTYLEEADLIRDIRVARDTAYLYENFVKPDESPTSKFGRYITRFDPKLEGDKPKDGKRSHSHWSEIDVKPIRDPSAQGIIIGLRRRLEYWLNKTEKTCWRAYEYVALEALGGEGDALQIQEEIAVRTVYKEEDRKTTPPPKCSKNCPHCHSSGGSYIWKDMTKVFVKGDSETAPFLLYAICGRCDDGKVLKCPPSFGTKNLNTHLGNVHGIRPPCKSQQVMSKKGKGVVGGSVLSV